MDNVSQRIWFANTSYESIEELAATFRQPEFYQEERAVRLEYYAMRIDDALQEGNLQARKELMRHFQLSLKYRLPIDDILADYFSKGFEDLVTQDIDKISSYPKSLNLTKAVGAPRSNDEKSYFPRVVAKAKKQNISASKALAKASEQNELLAKLMNAPSVQIYLETMKDVDLALMAELKAILTTLKKNKILKSVCRGVGRKSRKIVKHPLKNSKVKFFNSTRKTPDELQVFLQLKDSSIEGPPLPGFYYQNGKYRLLEGSYGTTLRNMQYKVKEEEDREKRVRALIDEYSN